ncbi:MAG TPA: hypothetical protein VFZ65_17680 [Planctomycetota bacterium]|nr:hypothetical protein [Planctomycetota bacterium]
MVSTRGALAVALTIACLPAQERLPVPDAAARAEAQPRLMDRLAHLLVEPGQGVGASDRVVALAADGSLDPALRYLLFEHAMRCALAAADVAAGLRAAQAAARVFADDTLPQSCVRGFETLAPLQSVVAAWLECARQTLGEPAATFDPNLARARSLASADRPRGLRDYVAQAADELEQAHRARLLLGAGPDRARLARFEAYYLGDWQPALSTAPGGSDRIARILRTKIQAHEEPRDIVALAHTAEQWLSEAQAQTDSLAQRQLRRRAMQLLVPLARYRAPAAADQPPLVEAIEVERVRRLLDRTTQLAVEPSVGSLRFREAADLERLHIDGGEWRVQDGLLYGRSLGPDAATRATARFAWQRIDCITIRGGIQSQAGLNFRIAVGPVNILFNWEVADQNHFYYRDAAGDRFQVTEPRLLRAGVEHTIVLRQVDDHVAVFVDGTEVTEAVATLAGTVCVYPAIGSEIFVRSIEVVGDVDCARVVSGPEWTR